MNLNFYSLVEFNLRLLSCFLEEETQIEDGNNVPLDSVVMVSVLSACSQVSGKGITDGIHGFVVKKGFDGSVGVGNTLMDGMQNVGILWFLGRCLIVRST